METHDCHWNCSYLTTPTFLQRITLKHQDSALIYTCAEWRKYRYFTVSLSVKSGISDTSLHSAYSKFSVIWKFYFLFKEQIWSRPLVKDAVCIVKKKLLNIKQYIRKESKTSPLGTENFVVPGIMAFLEKCLLRWGKISGVIALLPWVFACSSFFFFFSCCPLAYIIK